MANENLNTFWANIIVEELIRCGVDYFCISPGSRSTPLTAAVAGNKNAKSIICYDERNSAFHAVGYARASGKPAAIITTSGTACANLYPAIIEASNDNIPMIVLTADRPPELIDTSANQTIDQPNMFGDYTRFKFDLPCPDENIPPEMVLTTIDQSVFRSKYSNPGPVHINCRYRKPLEPTDDQPPAGYTKNIEAWTDSTDPFTKYEYPEVVANSECLDSLADDINKTDRGMIIVGKLNSGEQRKAVMGVINMLNWPVYADITSGLRLTDCTTNVIRYFDQELLTGEFNKKAAPSLVIHFGGRKTSKRVDEFLDQNRPDKYIIINNTPQRQDPIHAAGAYLKGDITDTCESLMDRIHLSEEGDYARFYADKALHADAIIARNIDRVKFMSEPFIARDLSKNIPENTSLVLSSSMPIRDVDLYSVSGRTGITVSANRGVSGIDGVISTASGFAAAKKELTTLLIGDMAFIHDINALAVLKKLDVPVIVVVINNRGGGIFHFLPISQVEDIFEDYFVAPHDHYFQGACETFGIDYYNPQDKKDFTLAYFLAKDNAKSAVIEVNTDRNKNLKLRRKIKKQIIEALEK
ncbi:MAG: 2-succinyl-5-enolpyruvyl-6-hydroxy-3-cyclohexene-1-carboxylic-acid synthase [Planctomycetes bacterium]|nr:2-succinyl-5-enolpyruvyl-6-hydroxy-3-cyclohexene-1-carboxylic-acid synthase [Planctomycetota bacterium]